MNQKIRYQYFNNVYLPLEHQTRYFVLLCLYYAMFSFILLVLFYLFEYQHYDNFFDFVIQRRNHIFLPWLSQHFISCSTAIYSPNYQHCSIPICSIQNYTKIGKILSRFQAQRRFWPMNIDRKIFWILPHHAFYFNFQQIQMPFGAMHNYLAYFFKISTIKSSAKI